MRPSEPLLKKTLHVSQKWPILNQLKLLLPCLLFLTVFFPVALAEVVQYDSAQRRDPFIPLVGPNGFIQKKVQSADLLVEGIIYDPTGGSVAIINGEVYRAGDNVKDARLIQIFKDRILMVQEDEEKTVWLREEIASKPASELNDTEKS